MWGKKKKQAVTEKDWEEEKIAAMRATIRTKAMCAREYRHGFLHSDEKKCKETTTGHGTSEPTRCFDHQKKTGHAKNGTATYGA